MDADLRHRIRVRLWAGLAVLVVIFGAGPVFLHFYGAGLVPPDIRDRQVTVRFTATKHPDMPWVFSPEQPQIKLHLDETGLAFFDVTNPTDHPVAGNATYVVTPAIAAKYLIPVACLCGSERVLAPGETAQFPMGFVVDPAIAYDHAADHVDTITLTYSFHEMPVPAKTAPAKTPGAPVKVD